MDLLRQHPTLIATLLANLFAATLPTYSRATVVETTLGQLVPTQFRADLVIELLDHLNAVLLVIVLEIQRGEDPDKRFSWPVYVAAARARSRCPACVVVIAPDESVARWAAKPIDLGLGCSTMTPIVFGPREVPLIGEDEARARVELALLSVIVHGDDDSVLPAARGAVSALAGLEAPGRSDYLYVIMRSLRAPLRDALRRWIMGKDETKEQYIAKFRPLLGEIADLLEAEGKAEGEALALLRVLEARGLHVTDAQRAQIESCRDLATLDRWLERAVTATSTDRVLE